MDLFQLKVFCSLGNTLNYKKTADELHITQPAVSYQIKALEAELGIRLLERDRHKTALTAAGIEFLRHAETMCEQERFAKERMRMIAGGGLGRLTIAGIQTYLSRISKAEALFLRQYPKIQIDTYMMDGPDLLHSFKFSESDIYFGAENMISENPNYQSEALVTDSMELCYHASMKAEAERMDWHSLQDLPYISIIEKNHLLYTRTQMILNDFDFHPAHINHCTTIESILSLVDAGCGIAILPAGSNADGHFSNVLTKTIDHEESKITMKVAWRTNANQPLIRLFMETMRREDSIF